MPDPHQAVSPSRPRVLCDAHATLADTAVPAGVLWRLTETDRQLDANLVRLAPGEDVGTHAESALDVLLVVIAGTGMLTTGDGALALTEGAVTWLPKGSTRAIAAGAHGLAYLTVHRRRPGLRIGSRPPGWPEQANRRAAGESDLP